MGSGLKGTFLVIDLWSGYGGLPLALLTMGCNFYCVSAEMDPVAREACAATMPNILHVTDVNQVRGPMFASVLARRKPRCILLGGGSPCQGNTALNLARRGLAGARSQQPLEIQRIETELQALPDGSFVFWRMWAACRRTLSKPTRSGWASLRFESRPFAAAGHIETAFTGWALPPRASTMTWSHLMTGHGLRGLGTSS